MKLDEHIRDIPDFPKEGIIFKDITPLLMNPSATKEVVNLISEHFKNHGITKVAAIESRGFIFGCPIAIHLDVGFIPVRKPGKLPYSTNRIDYELEYGTDAVEIHTDAVSEEDKVLIVDDLLATGGTAEATVKLIEKSGGQVTGLGFVIELGFLNGREKLSGYEILSLITY